MSHLTDEQLSAHLDGTLVGRAAEAVAAHLAQCEACRGQLAALAALDASLAGALEHDPGEGYFASFADRVAKRIAAEPARAAAVVDATRTARGGLSHWWNSPRSLAMAGGAFAILAVAAIGLVWSRSHGVDEFAKQARSESPSAESGAPAAGQVMQDEQTTPPAAPSSGTPDSPRAAEAPARDAARKAAQQAGALKQASPAPGGAREMSPQHVQEVRPLPNGEFEVVQPSNAPPHPAGPTRPDNGSGRVQKPMAQPLSGSPAEAKDAAPPANILASPLKSEPTAPSAATRSLAVPPSASANDLAGPQPQREKESANPGFMKSSAKRVDRLDERRAAPSTAPSAAEVSARAEAEVLAGRAQQSGSAAAWSAAADAWQKVLLLDGSGANVGNARYQVAAARVQAWRAERAPDALLAARSAVEAFLMSAPTGPRRATALLWRTELAGR